MKLAASCLKVASEPEKWLFTVPSGIGLRIRDHPTGPPSDQALIMISPPSDLERSISRRRKHKSFISKPLESKTRMIALSDRRVTGLARRITRQAVPRLRPFTRLPCTHSNPAWHRKRPSHLPRISRNRTRPSRRPPRSLPVVPSIQVEGTTRRLWWGYRGKKGMKMLSGFIANPQREPAIAARRSPVTIASSARFRRNTFTPGSPRMPRSAGSVFC